MAAYMEQTGKRHAGEQGTRFGSIEAVVNYLQMVYGAENFKKIYETVQVISDRLGGEMVIQDYEAGLRGLMSPTQIRDDIFLYLALLRMQQREAAATGGS